MSSRIRICRSTESYSVQIDWLTKALHDAEAVVIGAGAGLSTSAGFVYTGERFQKHFADFAKKYGYQDMYTGGFYPYNTPEEHWPIGAGTSMSIATWTRPNLSISSFLSW